MVSLIVMQLHSLESLSLAGEKKQMHFILYKESLWCQQEQNFDDIIIVEVTIMSTIVFDVRSSV